jgi:hypothetical protein
MKVELREFKTKYMAKLLELRQQLLEKYPSKRDRVEHVVDTLMTKLYNLRTFTLPDYIFTLYLAAKEFEEFKQMFPSEDEIRGLVEDYE